MATPGAYRRLRARRGLQGLPDALTEAPRHALLACSCGHGGVRFTTLNVQVPCAAPQGLQGVVWCGARRHRCELSPLSQTPGLLMQFLEPLMLLGCEWQTLCLLQQLVAVYFILGSERPASPSCAYSGPKSHHCLGSGVASASAVIHATRYAVSPL
jgi:hypothetical protein